MRNVTTMRGLSCDCSPRERRRGPRLLRATPVEERVRHEQRKRDAQRQIGLRHVECKRREPLLRAVFERPRAGDLLQNCSQISHNAGNL